MFAPSFTQRSQVPFPFCCNTQKVLLIDKTFFVTRVKWETARNCLSSLQNTMCPNVCGWRWVAGLVDWLAQLCSELGKNPDTLLKAYICIDGLLRCFATGRKTPVLSDSFVLCFVAFLYTCVHFSHVSEQHTIKFMDAMFNHRVINVCLEIRLVTCRQ